MGLGCINIDSPRARRLGFINVPCCRCVLRWKAHIYERPHATAPKGTLRCSALQRLSARTVRCAILLCSLQRTKASKLDQKRAGLHFQFRRYIVDVTQFEERQGVFLFGTNPFRAAPTFLGTKYLELVRDLFCSSVRVKLQRYHLCACAINNRVLHPMGCIGRRIMGLRVQVDLHMDQLCNTISKDKS